MTGPGDVSRETSTPWRTYLDREHAARDQYLATTQAAHREYLAGPWPDRGYYLTVERDAYTTYYAAGRRAWQNYRDAMDTPPSPPPAPAPDATGAGTQWAKKTGYRLPSPPPDSYPYPVPQSVVVTGDLNHGQATFTPYPGNGQPDQPDQWPGNYLADGPRPDTRDHEGRIIMWADPPRVTDRPETES